MPKKLKYFALIMAFISYIQLQLYFFLYVFLKKNKVVKKSYLLLMKKTFFSFKVKDVRFLLIQNLFYIHNMTFFMCIY